MKLPETIQIWLLKITGKKIRKQDRRNRVCVVFLSRTFSLTPSFSLIIRFESNPATISTQLFQIYEITRDNTDMSLENYRYNNAKTGSREPRLLCVSLPLPARGHCTHRQIENLPSKNGLISEFTPALVFCPLLK